MPRLARAAGLTVVAVIAVGHISYAADEAGSPSSTLSPQISSPNLPSSPHGWKARLQELHDRLNVTEAQKGSWNALEATLRHNHELMRQALLEQRHDASSSTALDAFAAYRRIAEIHLENIKRVTAAFTDFYGRLSPGQKEIADGILRSRVPPPSAAPERQVK